MSTIHPDRAASSDSMIRAASLFSMLALFTAVLYLVSRTGLTGATRGVVLLGLAALQACLAAVLLLGVTRERPWVKGLLLLVLFLLFGLLVGPTFSVMTAPIL